MKGTYSFLQKTSKCHIFLVSFLILQMSLLCGYVVFHHLFITICDNLVFVFPSCNLNLESVQKADSMAETGSVLPLEGAMEGSEEGFPSAPVLREGCQEFMSGMGISLGWDTRYQRWNIGAG